MATGGHFVVAWEGERAFGDDTDVLVRRFWGDNPQGPEYRVNTYTTSPQDWPSVASAADGRFVIVWRSFFQDGSDTGVFGQRFSPLGNPEGVEFRVNTTTAGDQNRPAVASGEDGRFLVAWESYKQVFAQAFDATGSFDAVLWLIAASGAVFLVVVTPLTPTRLRAGSR